MIRVVFNTGHMRVALELPDGAVRVTNTPGGAVSEVELAVFHWPGNIAEPLDELVTSISRDLVGELVGDPKLDSKATDFTHAVIRGYADLFLHRVSDKWQRWATLRRKARADGK